MNDHRRRLSVSKWASQPFASQNDDGDVNRSNTTQYRTPSSELTVIVRAAMSCANYQQTAHDHCWLSRFLPAWYFSWWCWGRRGVDLLWLWAWRFGVAFGGWLTVDEGVEGMTRLRFHLSQQVDWSCSIVREIDVFANCLRNARCIGKVNDSCNSSSHLRVTPTLNTSSTYSHVILRSFSSFIVTPTTDILHGK